jgi:hypothetical protein
MELSKPLLANSDLKVVPALGELMLYSVKESRGFVLLKACKYQSMGATWRHR